MAVLLVASACGGGSDAVVVPAVVADAPQAVVPDAPAVAVPASLLPAVQDVAPKLAFLGELAEVHSAPVNQVFDASPSFLQLADGAVVRVAPGTFAAPTQIDVALVTMFYNKSVAGAPEGRVYVLTAPDQQLAQPVVIEIPKPSDSLTVSHLINDVWTPVTVAAGPTTRIELTHFSTQHFATCPNGASAVPAAIGVVCKSAPGSGASTTGSGQAAPTPRPTTSGQSAPTPRPTTSASSGCQTGYKLLSSGQCATPNTNCLQDGLEFTPTAGSPLTTANGCVNRTSCAGTGFTIRNNNTCIFTAGSAPTPTPTTEVQINVVCPDADYPRVSGSNCVTTDFGCVQGSTSPLENRTESNPVNRCVSPGFCQPASDGFFVLGHQCVHEPPHFPTCESGYSLVGNDCVTGRGCVQGSTSPLDNHTGSPEQCVSPGFCQPASDGFFVLGHQCVFEPPITAPSCGAGYFDNGFDCVSPNFDCSEFANSSLDFFDPAGGGYCVSHSFCQPASEFLVIDSECRYIGP